jgi:hypothetical protein
LIAHIECIGEGLLSISSEELKGYDVTDVKFINELYLDSYGVGLSVSKILSVTYQCDKCGYKWTEPAIENEKSNSEDEMKKFLNVLTENVDFDTIFEACPESLRPKLYEYIIESKSNRAKATLALKAKDLPPEILKQLVFDENDIVRERLLDNPFLPEEYLFILLNDKNANIREKAKIKIAMRKKLEKSLENILSKR